MRFHAGLSIASHGGICRVDTVHRRSTGRSAGSIPEAFWANFEVDLRHGSDKEHSKLTWSYFGDRR